MHAVDTAVESFEKSTAECLTPVQNSLLWKYRNPPIRFIFENWRQIVNNFFKKLDDFLYLLNLYGI